MTRSDPRSFTGRRICMMLLLTISSVIMANQDACDKKNCPGPLRYYNELNCTPVYKNAGDCCAMEYDCTHLNDLSKEKCYVNGHVYDIGDKLREEDMNPCDIGCTCTRSYDNIARFVCAVVDCFEPPTKKNCYLKGTPNECCPGPEVCLNEGEERVSCVLDDAIYLDGEYFRPESDPEMECYCMPGYTGQNIEPFCKKPNRRSCNPIFHYPDDVHRNCSPIYYSSQKPQTDCNIFYRCQNDNDTVIHNHDTAKSASHEHTDDESTCKFGNMIMHVGDELNQATNYDSVCVKCVCEVPPVPTCRRLPDNECDVTKHQPFN